MIWHKKTAKSSGRRMEASCWSRYQEVAAIKRNSATKTSGLRSLHWRRVGRRGGGWGVRSGGLVDLMAFERVGGPSQTEPVLQFEGTVVPARRTPRRACHSSCQRL